MQQQTITYEDDLGDGEADEHRGTIISLNGYTVEIDLSDDNFTRLDAFLKEFLHHGRRVTNRGGVQPQARRGRTNQVPTRSAVKSAVPAKAIRDYFASIGRGDEIAPIGRISQRHIDEYLASQAA
jgi:hypothetical protein